MVNSHTKVLDLIYLLPIRSIWTVPSKQASLTSIPWYPHTSPITHPPLGKRKHL